MLNLLAHRVVRMEDVAGWGSSFKALIIFIHGY